MTEDGPLRGLTWDHPRGFGPLDALDGVDRAGAAGSPTPISRRISWNRQPLEGFESTPLRQLAADYDALIIDHPHIADAVDDGALVAVDELFDVTELQRWRSATVGPSFDSYAYAGHLWALPIDAATQVLATKAGTPALDTWADVRDHATSENTVLCIAGPHAFSTIISILVGMEQDLAGEASFADSAALSAALEFLRDLRRRTSDGFDALNPIEALRALSTSPSITVIPLVYGYVNFVSEQPSLEFRNAPAWTPGGRRGTVLGGTGLAVTARGSRSPHLLEHARRLMDPVVQSTLVPANGGQPAAQAAWESPAVNAASHDFYRSTRQTMHDSWVRPRRRGWQAFYDRSSSAVRSVLADALTVQDATDRILADYLTLPTTPTTR